MTSIKDKIENVLELAIGVSIAAVLTAIVVSGATKADVD